MRIFFVIIWFSIFCLLYSTTTAQELQCRVDVLTPKVTGIDKTVIDNLRREMTEFMNMRRWTDHVYDQQERIKCSLTLTINAVPSADRLEGTMQIMIIRPVYNSTYETVLLNYNDKDVKFNYQPFQTVQFSDNSYVNNLSSILMFWGYMILGFDYDSYSLEGGTPYFEQARNIANYAAGSSDAEKGWQAGDGQRARYWLMENVLNNSYKSYRNIEYVYHRKGLDVMAEDVSAGRGKILDCLKDFQTLYQNNPSAVICREFVAAKSSQNASELLKIFKKAQPADKQIFAKIMSQVDPNNSSTYNAIVTADN